MALQEELGLPQPVQRRDHEAILSIVLAGQMLAKEGDRLLRPLGLTDSQFNVLMLLKVQAGPAGLNQTQLGRMLLVNRSNVTGLIDRMERSGLVERHAEAGDRRTKLLRLTEKGRELTDKAEAAYFDRIEAVIGGLSPDEISQLCGMLETIRTRLRAGIPAR